MLSWILSSKNQIFTKNFALQRHPMSEILRFCLQWIHLPRKHPVQSFYSNYRKKSLKNHVLFLLFLLFSLRIRLFNPEGTLFTLFYHKIRVLHHCFNHKNTVKILKIRKFVFSTLLSSATNFSENSKTNIFWQ